MVSRRGFLGMLGAGVGAFAVRPLHAQTSVPAEEGVPAVGAKKPNIILFLVDDMGWQDTSLPFYYKDGKPVVTRLNRRYKTPHMEALAKQGMLFSNAYACSVCSPTRCSLMSGMNAARHRVTDWTLGVDQADRLTQATEGLYPPRWAVNGLQPPGTKASGKCASPWLRDGDNKYWQPDPKNESQWKEYSMKYPFMNALTFPQVLKDNGYRTIHVGKAHWGSGNGPYNQAYTAKTTGGSTPGADPRQLGFDVNIAGAEHGGPATYIGKNKYGDGSGNHHMTPGLDENNYYNNNVFLTDALTTEALNELTAFRKSDKSTPFYLYMSHYAIHSPLDNARAWDHTRSTSEQLDQDTKNPNPGDGLGWNATERNYGTLIKGMDDSLGAIMKWVAASGEAENTLILFMADNGGLTISGRLSAANAPARAGKGSCYEGGIREPLIAVWPGKIADGSVSHEPVIIEDLYPTILEAAGLSVPDASALATTEYDDGSGVKRIPQVIDGESFLPVLLGRRTTVREDGSERPLLWHVPNCWQEAKGSDPAAYHFYSVVRQGRWKLIYQQSDQSFELYDLEADISETTNLAKRLPGKVDELRKVMGNLLRERGAQMPHIGSASGSLVPWPDEVPLKLGGLTLRN